MSLGGGGEDCAATDNHFAECPCLPAFPGHKRFWLTELDITGHPLRWPVSAVLRDNCFDYLAPEYWYDVMFHLHHFSRDYHLHLSVPIIGGTSVWFKQWVWLLYDTPSERRITEHRITERRIIERRITKHRITKHQITERQKLPNIEYYKTYCRILQNVENITERRI